MTRAAVGVIVFSALAVAALPHMYSIDWHAVDGGGAMVTIDGDGGVERTDLSILRSKFAVRSGASREEGVRSGDDAVNLTDRSMLLAVVGSSGD